MYTIGVFILSAAAWSMFHASSMPESQGVEHSADASAIISFVQDSPADGCIDSFASFAYRAPVRERIGQVTELSAPWQYISSLPAHSVSGFPASPSFGVFTENLASRQLNGHQEIWLVSTFLTDGQRLTLVSIYNVGSQTWETFSGNIEATAAYVDEIYVAPDGTVWASTSWYYLSSPQTSASNAQNVPVLSRFNEETRRFEGAPGVVEAALRDRSRARDYPRMVMDAQGAFWIFNVDQAIYRYDPAIQTTERAQGLGSIVVRDVAVAPGSDLYFSDVAGSSQLDLSQAQLFHYQPATNEVSPVQLPDTRWPNYSGLLVDAQNRLWLGAVGYRDTANNWHLVHASPEEYFENATSTLYWFTPRLLLESSDGRLWFYRYADTGALLDGTAWYNPATNEGCQFTTTPGSMIEDDQGQLWILLYDDLYRLDLSPQE